MPGRQPEAGFASFGFRFRGRRLRCALLYGRRVKRSVECCERQAQPDGKLNPEMMFGDGPHLCPGAHLAKEQITEIFQILFSQPGIRLANDADGWLAYVGPFPDRLDFVFKPETASSEQNLITVQAKVERDRFRME